MSRADEFCKSCGKQNENYKDYANPVFVKVYSALSMVDREPGEGVCDWLNVNGFANMTCCPICHVDDFTHVEGCPLAKYLDSFELRAIPKGPSPL